MIHFQMAEIWALKKEELYSPKLGTSTKQQAKL
jgi:hypothetical protein